MILEEPQGQWRLFIKLPFNLAEASTVVYKHKLFIFGGLASQPDKDKLSGMDCAYVSSPNDKEIVASHADDDAANNTQHESLWRWSRSDLDSSSIDNSSFFSRNIRQFGLEGNVKVNKT